MGHDIQILLTVIIGLAFTQLNLIFTSMKLTTPNLQTAFYTAFSSPKWLLTVEKGNKIRRNTL